MAHCTDSFSQGWQHMVKVLFSPVRVGFWFLMAFLIFITEDLLHISPVKFFPQTLMEEAAVDPSVLEPHLMTIIVVGVSYFFLALIFLLFSSAARLVYMTGVRNGSVSLFKALEELLPRIITYYLWNVIIPIIAFIILFVVMIVFTLVVLLPLGVTDPFSAGIAVMAIMVLIGLAAFFVTLVYLMIMRSFVVPMMVFQNKGIFSSIGSSIGLIFSNFFECAGFLMIRFAAMIGLIAVVILPTIGVVMIFDYIDYELLKNQDILRGFISNINILLFGLVIEPFLLPYNIFVDSYALAFLHKLTGDNRFISSADDENPNQPAPSAFSTDQPTAPPVDQPTPPSSTMPPMASIPGSNEPINFNDIPIENSQALQNPPETSTLEARPTEAPTQNTILNEDESKNNSPQPPNL